MSDNDFDFGLNFGDDFETSDGSDDLFNNTSQNDNIFGDGDQSDDGLSQYDDEDAKNKSDTRKTAITAIIIGVAIIVVMFLGINFVRNLSNKNKVTKFNNEPIQVNQSSVVESNINNSSTNYLNNNGWIEYESGKEDITFSDNYIDTTFSVTSIKHYVKVLNNENYMIKTVLYGALSGFTGTYELELPYSMGSKLSIGSNIKVQVKIGEYTKNILIIDEIKY